MLMMAWPWPHFGWRLLHFCSCFYFHSPLLHSAAPSMVMILVMAIMMIIVMVMGVITASYVLHSSSFLMVLFLQTISTLHSALHFGNWFLLLPNYGDWLSQSALLVQYDDVDDDDDDGTGGSHFLKNPTLTISPLSPLMPGGVWMMAFANWKYVVISVCSDQRLMVWFAKLWRWVEPKKPASPISGLYMQEGGGLSGNSKLKITIGLCF